jgi:hypothetical protein
VRKRVWTGEKRWLNGRNKTKEEAKSAHQEDEKDGETRQKQNEKKRERRDSGRGIIRGVTPPKLLNVYK